MQSRLILFEFGFDGGTHRSAVVCDDQVSARIGMIVAGSSPELRHRAPSDAASLVSSLAMIEGSLSFIAGVGEEGWRSMVSSIERHGRKTEGRRWEQKKRKERYTEYVYASSNDIWRQDCPDGLLSRHELIEPLSSERDRDAKQAHGGAHGGAHVGGWWCISLPHLPYDMEIRVTAWLIEASLPPTSLPTGWASKRVIKGTTYLPALEWSVFPYQTRGEGIGGGGGGGGKGGGGPGGRAAGAGGGGGQGRDQRAPHPHPSPPAPPPSPTPPPPPLLYPLPLFDTEIRSIREPGGR